MADLEKLLDSIKNETIETRNQIIKSSNQVVKLDADVRSFDKKLTALQSKNNLFLLVGFGILLLIMVGAAYWVTMAQTKAAEKELAEAMQQVNSLKSQFNASQDELARFKAAAKRDKSSRESAEQLAMDVLKLIDNKKDSEAITKIRENNLYGKQEILGPIAAAVVEEKINQFRRDKSDLLLKNGREAYNQKQFKKAISQLEVALALAITPANAENALYLLAISYANNQDRQLAIQHIEDFVRRFPKSAMADDALYHLGTFCEQWTDEECAHKAWQKLLSSYPASPMVAIAKKKLNK